MAKPVVEVTGRVLLANGDAPADADWSPLTVVAGIAVEAGVVVLVETVAPVMANPAAQVPRQLTLVNVVPVLPV